jgi:hypothetical protein
MEQAGTGTAADRRKDRPHAVINDKAVGVSRIDKSSLDHSPIKLASGHELVEHKACAVERVVPLPRRDVG